MEADSPGFYQALAARDRRFDGIFFVGVTSTGIYCRPICPARTPRAANCRFFAGAHQAEQAGFRPCLRCRPELAPGHAPVDASQRIAQLIVQQLADGVLEGDAGLEAIAGQFELSSRQIRRIVRKELGVAPVQLLQTRRLLLAKQLLTETTLSVTQIAFASGFSSLRRFNDAFNSRYRLAPSRLRKAAASTVDSAAAGETSVLQLGYRPPYDWSGTLAFLKARELRRVERIDSDSYARTVQLGAHSGWIRVRRSAAQHALLLEFSHGLLPVLPTLIARVRNLFDLDARPELIAARLAPDPRLAALVRRTPGMRVPGAFDGCELALRAILGQQITVRAAGTLAGRLVELYGAPLVTPVPGLDRLSPAAARIAGAEWQEIAALGVTGGRARSLVALARAQVSGALRLDGGGPAAPERAIAGLCELPGIGPWTAHYIAMRALRWPDAFPPGDVVVRGRLAGMPPQVIDALSQGWRPWRSYALMYLWRTPATSELDHAEPSRDTAARPPRDPRRRAASGHRRSRPPAGAGFR